MEAARGVRRIMRLLPHSNMIAIDGGKPESSRRVSEVPDGAQT